MARPYGARETSPTDAHAIPMTDETESQQPAANQGGNKANFLQFMPPFIRDLHARGVDINLDPKTFELQLGGFYGNGHMRLVSTDGGGFVAIDKNGKRTPVATFDELVRLNFEWWQAANTRGRYAAPARPWIDGFRAQGLVKRCVIYVSKENPSVEGEAEGGDAS